VLEGLATGSADRWQYAEVMPRLPILGTGLAPLGQWLVLPPIVLWLTRRHLAGAAALSGDAVVSTTNRPPPAVGE